MIPKKCKNCCKQYFCENYKKINECKDFVSWLETKNYGEVKRIEGGKNVQNKKRKFRRIKRR